jgi:hypothetical protein
MDGIVAPAQDIEARRKLMEQVGGEQWRVDRYEMQDIEAGEGEGISGEAYLYNTGCRLTPSISSYTP